MDPDRDYPAGAPCPEDCSDADIPGDPAADHAFLIRLANTRMPFGKYRGRLLIDLPEPYVVWFRGQGFPAGDLGTMLASLYEIKANGLEPLLRPLVRPSDGEFGNRT